jgi:hypothetical protein
MTQNEVANPESVFLCRIYPAPNFRSGVFTVAWL